MYKLHVASYGKDQWVSCDYGKDIGVRPIVFTNNAHNAKHGVCSIFTVKNYVRDESSLEYGYVEETGCVVPMSKPISLVKNDKKSKVYNVESLSEGIRQYVYKQIIPTIDSNLTIADIEDKYIYDMQCGGDYGSWREEPYTVSFYNRYDEFMVRYDVILRNPLLYNKSVTPITLAITHTEIDNNDMTTWVPTLCKYDAIYDGADPASKAAFFKDFTDEMCRLTAELF